MSAPGAIGIDVVPSESLKVIHTASYQRLREAGGAASLAIRFAKADWLPQVQPHLEPGEEFISLETLNLVAPGNTAGRKPVKSPIANAMIKNYYLPKVDSVKKNPPYICEVEAPRNYRIDLQDPEIHDPSGMLDFYVRQTAQLRAGDNPEDLYLDEKYALFFINIDLFSHGLLSIDQLDELEIDIEVNILSKSTGLSGIFINFIYLVRRNDGEYAHRKHYVFFPIEREIATVGFHNVAINTRFCKLEDGGWCQSAQSLHWDYVAATYADAGPAGADNASSQIRVTAINRSGDVQTVSLNASGTSYAPGSHAGVSAFHLSPGSVGGDGDESDVHVFNWAGTSPVPEAIKKISTLDYIGYFDCEEYIDFKLRNQDPEVSLYKYPDADRPPYFKFNIDKSYRISNSGFDNAEFQWNFYPGKADIPVDKISVFFFSLEDVPQDWLTGTRRLRYEFESGCTIKVQELMGGDSKSLDSSSAMFVQRDHIGDDDPGDGVVFGALGVV